MIRFILQRKFKHEHSGLEVTSFETLDAFVPELERALSRGGSGENGYDYTHLAGVEVIEVDVSAALQAAKGGGDNGKG